MDAITALQVLAGAAALAPVVWATWRRRRKSPATTGAPSAGPYRTSADQPAPAQPSPVTPVASPTVDLSFGHLIVTTRLADGRQTLHDAFTIAVRGEFAIQCDAADLAVVAAALDATPDGEPAALPSIDGAPAFVPATRVAAVRTTVRRAADAMARLEAARKG